MKKYKNKYQTEKEIGDIVQHVTGGPKFVIRNIEEPTRFGFPNGMVFMERVTKKGKIIHQSESLELFDTLYIKQ